MKKQNFRNMIKYTLKIEKIKAAPGQDVYDDTTHFVTHAQSEELISDMLFIPTFYSINKHVTDYSYDAELSVTTLMHNGCLLTNEYYHLPIHKVNKKYFLQLESLTNITSSVTINVRFFFVPFCRIIFLLNIEIKL